MKQTPEGAPVPLTQKVLLQSVSAEHGLGKRKRGLLELQYKPDQIEAMKQVKRRLDPQWLLGQGTLFPL